MKYYNSFKEGTKTPTLIVHPSDRSTDFLKPIYDKVGFKTVVSKGVDREIYNELLKSSERVVMMGHGSPFGLFNVGECIVGTGWGSAISTDEETVAALKDKDNVYVWCYASEYVRDMGLKGFCSGMFISEVAEARVCGVQANQEIVDESNNTFAYILGKHINKSGKEIFNEVTKEYKVLAKTNPVAKYNLERMKYYNGKQKPKERIFPSKNKNLYDYSKSKTLEEKLDKEFEFVGFVL